MERISQPNGVLRIGLRYIDEIRVPGIDSAPGDWRGYIDEHLLAATDPAFIPASLRPSEWLGLVQYQTAPDSMLTLRYGPQSGYAVDSEGPTRRRDPHPRGRSSCWTPTRTGTTRPRCRSSTPTGSASGVTSCTSRSANSSGSSSPTSSVTRCSTSRRGTNSEDNQRSRYTNRSIGPPVPERGGSHPDHQGGGRRHRALAQPDRALGRRLAGPASLGGATPLRGARRASPNAGQSASSGRSCRHFWRS